MNFNIIYFLILFICQKFFSSYWRKAEVNFQELLTDYSSKDDTNNYYPINKRTQKAWYTLLQEVIEEKDSEMELFEENEDDEEDPYNFDPDPMNELVPIMPHLLIMSTMKYFKSIGSVLHDTDLHQFELERLRLCDSRLVFLRLV